MSAAAYECREGHSFDVYQAERATDTDCGEAWGASYCETETFLICPFCGSEELEEC